MPRIHREEAYMGLYKDRNYAVGAAIEGDEILVSLRDGRCVHVPVAWFEWLKNATPDQQADINVTGPSLFWRQLDDGISMETVLLGKPGTW